jgi:hypothetical protein
MNTQQALINRSKLGSGQEPSNKQRRTFLRGSLAALLASPLLASPRRVMAKETKTDAPNEFFILLLAGVYQPVPLNHGPKNNLGLSAPVNLNDGSYIVTRIYPVFGIGNEGSAGEDKGIGNFYVQFPAGNLCAYDLPGGAIAMQFQPHLATDREGFNNWVPFSDGGVGTYLEGTFELDILQATGVYQAFQGGHNHMVDRLHQLGASSNGPFDEFCFCNISQYQFP